MADEIPAGSKILTPDDMWDVVQETRDLAKKTQATVEELKNLVHPALADVRADVQALDAREQKHHDEHERAIHKLQESMWSSKWVPSLVTAIITAIVVGASLYFLSHGQIN